MHTPMHNYWSGENQRETIVTVLRCYYYNSSTGTEIVAGTSIIIVMIVDDVCVLIDHS